MTVAASIRATAVRPLPFPDAGEIAVLGLGKSGVAAAGLLASLGHRVYASDSGASPALRDAARGLAARDVRIAAEAGVHDLARIARAALAVVSPGISPDAAPLRAAHEAGVDIVSEVEIALRVAPDMRYVAVTGTNGKTTTTALVGHLLRALGHDAPDAGNIGTPLCGLVARGEWPPWVSLELSSFQLHDTPSVAPDVGVVTNLAPDHLDRYPSVDAYYADKALLFRNAVASSRWVLNADDAESMARLRPDAGERLAFSVRHPADAWYDSFAGALHVLGAPLVARAQLQLLGDHNVANALAAALAVMAADPAHRTADARATLAAALGTFRALPHRLERVGEWGGVEWINDSKATNVASTLVAVEGMVRPTILLLGGRHKGEPYTTLAAAARGHVRQVVAYGEAAPIVAGDLGRALPVERVDGTFEEVVAAARRLAAPGDAILLSPACSSYDMFNNYVERGERFRALAVEGA